MPRAKVSQVAERRALVFDKLVAGVSMAQIARDLDINVDTVYRDVKALSSQLEKHAREQLQATLATAVSNYQRVVDEAWAGFKDSQTKLDAWLAGDYDRVEETAGRDGETYVSRKAPTLRLQMAEYLDKILTATQRLTKMAGVEGTDKLELSGRDGGPIMVIEVAPPRETDGD